VLIAISAFFYVANYFAGFSALFMLRKKEPDLPRPFRAWGYPWTTLIFLIGSFVFLIGDIIGDPLNASFALIYIVLSIPAYFWIKKLNAT
jgi:APA family basic amino acid/polyamine antiporter